jgi:hypothetical protein
LIRWLKSLFRKPEVDDLGDAQKAAKEAKEEALRGRMSGDANDLTSRPRA